MKNSLGNKTNAYLYIIIIMCMLNFLFMHYFFISNLWIETKMYLFSFPANFFSCIFDLSILYIIFFIITKFSCKKALILLFIASWLISLINVFYGRFFMQYIPLSAFSQVGSLTDGIVVNSIKSGFKWWDLYYLFTFITFLLVVVKMNYQEKHVSRKQLVILFAFPLLAIIGIFVSYSAYHIAKSDCRHNFELFLARINELIIEPEKEKDSFPNGVRFQSGLIRPFLAEVNEVFSPYKLTNEQCESIKNEYRNLDERVTSHVCNPKLRNVVFILLESFMSSTSELKVNGKYITPFLDSLKHSNDVYYNGRIHSNITIGESGDGQLIYMTGLLPLRSILSVGVAKDDTIPSLPSILKNKMGIGRTEIVTPSRPGMWQQENMNKVYGIDYCYSELDTLGVDMTDKVTFDLAKRTGKTLACPFYSMVLSLSTHLPYRKYIDPDFNLKDNTFPHAYLVYLNACHYLDVQIRSYFNHLKKSGMYDNSLIIIASDHPAHIGTLGMEGRIDECIPLYIINGNIDNKNAYNGDCNQIDVFTTILDVLDLKTDWHGLGKSLLNPNYTNSISDRTWQLSEWIIRGNYFKNN